MNGYTRSIEAKFDVLAHSDVNVTFWVKTQIPLVPSGLPLPFEAGRMNIPFLLRRVTSAPTADLAIPRTGRRTQLLTHHRLIINLVRSGNCPRILHYLNRRMLDCDDPLSSGVGGT